jgi:hypothetical protein
MKKLLLMLGFCLYFSGFAGAMSVSNPVYMPNEGGIMFDTHISMKGNTSGASEKVYTLTETLSYNLTDRFQLGGYLGYSRISAIDENGLTNPGFFAVFRLFDNLVKLDGGIGAEIDIFDDYSEGGVSEGANKFSAFARTAFDIGAASAGAYGGLSYWDGSGSKNITKDGYRSAVNGDINAFVIFDILDMIGVGGEAGYRVYDINRDGYYNGYRLTGRLDFNPLPSRLGAQVYATFQNMQNIDDAYILGVKIRLVI